MYVRSNANKATWALESLLNGIIVIAGADTVALAVVVVTAHNRHSRSDWKLKINISSV